MSRTTPLLAAFAFTLVACAGNTTPLTEYGYSSWASRTGASVKGEFLRARQECFERLGIEDPASVVKNSPMENRYATCMHTKGWCSDSGSCH